MRISKSVRTSATILLDSVIDGVRVTTFELCFPRIVLAEFGTHRVFSKNAASSRAIPHKKLLKSCDFLPDVWRLNDKGMQPKRVASKVQATLADIVWLTARRLMIICSTLLRWIGIHKELCNRLMEPWMYVRVIMTTTEIQNFFSLRCHPDAQREIWQLARCVWAEYERSVPVLREMHIPYVDDRLYFSYDITAANAEKLLKLLKRSVARCARVSYLTHDGKDDPGEDLKLFDRLVVQKPLHASPSEHQVMSKKAFAVLAQNLLEWRSLVPVKKKKNMIDSIVDNLEQKLKEITGRTPNLGGNLGNGVIQYRKLLELIPEEHIRETIEISSGEAERAVLAEKLLLLQTRLETI